MTNKEYFAALNRVNESFAELRTEGITLAKEIIGETFTKDDLFFCSTLDRCMHLIDGLLLLLKDRNLTCAGALLRLQMDNCMRTYSAFIAADRGAVIDCLINGAQICKQKDETGKEMKDWHLKKRITELDSSFDKVYEHASGYIHLSEKALYQTVFDVNDEKLILQIGHALPERRNEPLLECAKAFHHYVVLHYKMLNAVAESKQRFELHKKSEYCDA